MCGAIQVNPRCTSIDAFLWKYHSLIPDFCCIENFQVNDPWEFCIYPKATITAYIPHDLIMILREDFNFNQDGLNLPSPFAF